MYIYSINFRLFAIFLAILTIYTIKGNKISKKDILYGFILSSFYYLLFCIINQYQIVKEGYSSMIPSDNDNSDYSDNDNSDYSDNNNHSIPTTPHGTPIDSSKHHHSIPTPPHGTPIGPSKHHHSIPIPPHGTPINPSKKQNNKPNQINKMNNKKRPSINKHQLEDPLTAVAGIDAPINITINLDDDLRKEYKKIPNRRNVDPQFDDGLTADRLSKIERRIEELVTRDLDNQYKEIVERSPEFSREPKIIYKYKEKECPVCPLVAEKPWSEWEDASHQRKEWTHRDKNWNVGMRGGNNPLPVLP
jgi:hypothetical protein